MTMSHDQKFYAKLNADDEAFLNDLERESGLFEQMGATFSGPLKYWVAFAFILSFTFFGLSVWALYEMFNADTVKVTLLWGALFVSGILSVSMIKIWFWLRMNHLAVLKELKIIQLSVLRAAAEVDASSSSKET